MYQPEMTKHWCFLAVRWPTWLICVAQLQRLLECNPGSRIAAARALQDHCRFPQRGICATCCQMVSGELNLKPRHQTRWRCDKEERVTRSVHERHELHHHHGHFCAMICLARMEELSINKAGGSVCFGQLLGMCDHVSLTLGELLVVSPHRLHVLWGDTCSATSSCSPFQLKRATPCTSPYPTAPLTTRCPICCVGPRRTAPCCRGSAKSETCWGESCTGGWVSGEAAEDESERGATTTHRVSVHVAQERILVLFKLVKCEHCFYLKIVGLSFYFNITQGPYWIISKYQKQH